MNDEARRFPLSWPLRRPRCTDRIYGRFHGTATGYYPSGGKFSRNTDLTIAAAINRVQEELDRIGAHDVVLSSNLQTRLDGLPRSGQAQPNDPGVCLYFKLKGKPHALPCDRYTKVEQNIAAVAAHIEATRAIERYGVADMAEMFTGFQAISHESHRSWRDVLGCPNCKTIDSAEHHYRRARALSHPDRGGTAEDFHEVERAWEQAQQELSV